MDPDLDASVYAIAHTDQPEGIDGDALVIVGQWCASLVSLTGAPVICHWCFNPWY